MDTHGKEERDGTERQPLEQQMGEAEQGASSRVQQLEAMFEAIGDGLFVYDTDGRLLRMNRAARDLLGLYDLPGYTALSLEERGTLLTRRYVQGQSLPLAQWATTRVLSGEVLTDTTAVEFTVRNLRGRELRIQLSGAPSVTGKGTSWERSTSAAISRSAGSLRSAHRKPYMPCSP